LAQPISTSSTSPAVDAGALDRGLDGEAAQRGAVGHVEGALPALGQGRAGGGDDDGLVMAGVLGSREAVAGDIDHVDIAGLVGNAFLDECVHLRSPAR
jgi:hypothetical protein